jgi:hypothetical protein
MLQIFENFTFFFLFTFVLHTQKSLLLCFIIFFTQQNRIRVVIFGSNLNLFCKISLIFYLCFLHTLCDKHQTLIPY